MPASKTRRSAVLALALLMVAAVPARATTPSTPSTFTVVDSIQPGSNGSYAMDYSESVAFGGYLYFSANDGTSGYELWRTNGTTTQAFHA